MRKLILFLPYAITLIGLVVIAITVMVYRYRLMGYWAGGGEWAVAVVAALVVAIILDERRISDGK